MVQGFLLVRQFEYKIWTPRKDNAMQLQAQTKDQNFVLGSDFIVNGHDHEREFPSRDFGDYIVAGNEFDSEHYDNLETRYLNRIEYGQDYVVSEYEDDRKTIDGSEHGHNDKDDDDQSEDNLKERDIDGDREGGLGDFN